MLDVSYINCRRLLLKNCSNRWGKKNWLHVGTVLWQLLESGVRWPPWTIPENGARTVNEASKKKRKGRIETRQRIGSCSHCGLVVMTPDSSQGDPSSINCRELCFKTESEYIHWKILLCPKQWSRYHAVDSTCLFLLRLNLKLFVLEF